MQTSEARPSRGAESEGASGAAARVTVRGVVQGVGFRPFVYRLAARHHVSGWVVNSERGVVAEVEGREEDVRAFVEAIEAEAPPLARIDRVETDPIAPAGHERFEIQLSRSRGGETTLICPDVAVCEDCLREFLDPGDRRYHYPFINCTNCGPRFSIIDETPYDRPKTSMRSFPMCPDCRREYDDPGDRRFHAQPNACPDCGPRLRLELPGAEAIGQAEIVTGRSYLRVPDGFGTLVRSDPAAAARWLLKRGAILGVRGLGGFHIAVDASNDSSVRALREKKNRPAKPFALMCRSVEVARSIAHIDDDEAGLMSGPWAPVVLVRKRPEAGVSISRGVAPGNASLGLMLPYAPLHHLLFDEDLPVLIMTSANTASEPIIADIETARERLAPLTATFLDHDRDVVNRTDDSVAFVEAGQTMIVRRSRGYAPYPIDLRFETADVLACGTELKNTFAFLKSGRAYVSQHIGDMENVATLEFFEEAIEKFESWFHLDPDVVAHDLHPDYMATRFALEYAAREPRRRLMGVQHHHAHVVSVMAEHGVTEPTIGLALDGTGYGPDGAIWGCEFLVADLAGYERAGHLRPVPLAGGDAAIRHPYRTALSHLFAAGGEELLSRGLDLFRDVPARERELVVQQIVKGLNTVETTSAGRLFDAVSAILGVCHEISYEAQAAIELESLVASRSDRAYPYRIAEDGGRVIVDPSPTIAAALEDALSGVNVAEAAEAFHNTVVAFCRDAVARISSSNGIRRVALSGGVFQNRCLVGRLAEALRQDGHEVLLNRMVPTNDGGVSLGQAVVASERSLRGLPSERDIARGV